MSVIARVMPSRMSSWVLKSTQTAIIAMIPPNMAPSSLAIALASVAATERPRMSVPASMNVT